MIPLTINDFVEAFDRIFNRNQYAFQTGELLRYEERLRQEALYTTSAGNYQFIFFRKFFQTQNGDDILQFFIPLQDLLHTLSGVIVLVAKDFGGIADRLGC